MSAYEAGFARGEMESFKDREHGETKDPPLVIRDDYWRGFWDGYTARSSAWVSRRPGYRVWLLAQEAA